MGCTNSREILRESEIESLILSNSEKLGLFHYKSEFLDRVIHRNSKDLKMSEAQLTHMLKSLKLVPSNSNIQSFFKFFYSEKHNVYNSQKLSTLGILLGKSSYKEKLFLLFQNYDVDFTDTLTKDEVLTMIDHIYYITCHCLPVFSLQFYEDEKKEAIYKYKNKLNIVGNGISKFYANWVFEDYKENVIGYKEFENIMCGENLRGIFEAECFRRKTLDVCRTIRRAAAAVDYYMTAEDKEFIQRVKNFASPMKSKTNKVG